MTMPRTEPSLSAAQTAAAQHRRCDAVKLVKIAMVRRPDRVRIERDQDTGNTRKQSRNRIALAVTSCVLIPEKRAACSFDRTASK